MRKLLTETAKGYLICERIAHKFGYLKKNGRPTVKHTFLLVMLTIFLAVPIKPQTAAPPAETGTTGMDLVKGCGISSTLMEAKDMIAQTYCLGLVRGVFAIMATTGHLHYTTFVSNGQMVLVVKKYLDEHPERLGETDFVLARDALRAAFPPTEENRKRISNPACQPVLQA